MTLPRDYDSWSTTLVDWLLRVSRGYKPPDLVPVGEAGIAGPGLIRAVAINDLRAMTRAAARNGTPIAVNSPYRSYADQVASFNGWVNVDGYDDAITYSQRPGHSEHQLGLTIDFMTLGGGSSAAGRLGDGSVRTLDGGERMEVRVADELPAGRQRGLFNPRTCFHYEPWHYRYLGRAMARKVHNSGLTIREYLWKHYTMVDPRTGEPLATPTPIPTASPTPVPTATATQTAAPSTGSSATAAPSAASPSSGDGPLGMDPLVFAALGVAAVVLAGIAFITRRGGSAG